MVQGKRARIEKRTRYELPNDWQIIKIKPQHSHVSPPKFNSSSIPSAASYDNQHKTHWFSFHSYKMSTAKCTGIFLHGTTKDQKIIITSIGMIALKWTQWLKYMMDLSCAKMVVHIAITSQKIPWSQRIKAHLAILLVSQQLWMHHLQCASPDQTIYSTYKCTLMTDPFYMTSTLSASLITQRFYQ